jgi:dihydroflavonol-4-reductase
VSGQVLLTGGTGFVGRALVRRLVEAGRPVRALTRTAEGERTLAELGATPVRGDLLDAASLAAAMDGAEVVYHVGGVNAFCPRDPGMLFRVNVEGSRAVVRAAIDAGARRLVYTSSAATLGEAHGTVGREDAPHRGTFLSHYERSKYEAERAVMADARAGGLELVSVNPASVQGPGRVRGTARILLDYLNGRLRVIVDSRLSVVDIDDCVEGHLLAEARGAPGERYVLSGATLTVREAVALLGRIVGRDDRPRRLPPPVALAAATGVETIARARGRTPSFCREMIRTVLHGHAYDGSRATRELGLRYTPIEESIRRTVAWYVAEGLVRDGAGPG